MTKTHHSRRGSSNIAGLAVLVVLLLAAGFLGWKILNPHRTKPIPPAPGEEPLKKWKGTTANLYFDRSGSMKGFVNHPAPASPYRKFVEDIETVLTTGVAPDVEIFGFGDQVSPVKDRTLYQKVDFYNQEETKIDAAVAHARERGNLALIVTDLFQNQGEVARLTKPLSEYISATDSVGLIGGVSPFDGTVWWGDTNKESFKHKGTLPFYVLIFGPTEGVTHTLLKLEEKIFADARFCPQEDCQVISILFSKKMAKLLAQQDQSGKRVDVEVAGPAGDKTPQGFQMSSLVQAWSGDSRIQQIELVPVKGKFGGDLNLKLPVFWTHDRAVGTNIKLAPASVLAFRELKGAKADGGYPPDGWTNAPEAVSTFEPQPCRLARDLKEITCPIRIQSKLPTSDNYLFRFDVPLGSSRAINLDEWSFDQELAVSGDRVQNSFKDSRGRTRNLKLFVDGLLELVSGDPPPIVTRGYLVVRNK